MPLRDILPKEDNGGLSHPYRALAEERQPRRRRRHGQCQARNDKRDRIAQLTTEAFNLGFFGDVSADTESKARELIGALAENHMIFRALQGRNIVSSWRDDPRTLGEYLGTMMKASPALPFVASRPRERQSLYLIQDDDGRQLTALALRSRFDKARKAAGVSFQFRDIRAKTASDTGDLGHSQKLLGHKNRDMTEHYVRDRIGQRVKPLR